MKMHHELIENPLLLEIELFTLEECKKLIKCAEKIGFHHPEMGYTFIRSEIVDSELAKKIWKKVEHLLPKVITVNNIKFNLECINEHFRLLKYDEGGSLPIHLDGYVIDQNHFRSMFSLYIFLNDEESGLEGGGITFYTNDMEFKTNIEPKSGKCVLFYAKHYHSGDIITKGYKYLLRTDVMVS